MSTDTVVINKTNVLNIRTKFTAACHFLNQCMPQEKGLIYGPEIFFDVKMNLLIEKTESN